MQNVALSGEASTVRGRDVGHNRTQNVEWLVQWPRREVATGLSEIKVRTERESLVKSGCQKFPTSGSSTTSSLVSMSLRMLIPLAAHCQPSLAGGFPIQGLPKVRFTLAQRAA